MRTMIRLKARVLSATAAVALAAAVPAAALGATNASAAKTGAAIQATTTAVAQPGGGYITTYTAPNGDVTSVYTATPVTISAGAPTSQQITVNGATVTEYSENVTVTPTSAFGKPALPGSVPSSYSELLALGANPADIASFTSNSNGGSQIGPPACAHGTYDSKKLHVYGCDVTYKVGSSGAVWYLTDSTESSGTMHDPTCIASCDHITGLKFGTSYGSGNIIQHWKPGNTYPVGSCVSNTVSLTYQGSGVSSTATQCPETFGLYGIGTTYFSTKWDGQGNGPSNGARDTHAVDAVYDGAGASPYPSVYFTVWWTTCC